MKGIKVCGRMIDVYKFLRDLSWSNPGMTLAEFIQAKTKKHKSVLEEIEELYQEIQEKKNKGE